MNEVLQEITRSGFCWEYSCTVFLEIVWGQNSSLVREVSECSVQYSLHELVLSFLFVL